MNKSREPQRFPVEPETVMAAYEIFCPKLQEPSRHLPGLPASHYRSGTIPQRNPALHLRGLPFREHTACSMAGA